jgi:hypothetical protein
MLWARMVAYVAGTVNQELLLRNEYLGAENRILRRQIKGRLLLSEGEKATLAEIAQRLGRKALEHQIQKQKEESETKQAISATELAAEKTAQNAVLGESNQVGAKYQGQLPSEPTYDLLREADIKIEKLQEELRSFEFHGYLRSGYGLNRQGANKLPSKLQEQMQSTVWEMRPKRMRNSFLSTTG